MRRSSPRDDGPYLRGGTRPPRPTCAPPPALPFPSPCPQATPYQAMEGPSTPPGRAPFRTATAGTAHPLPGAFTSPAQTSSAILNLPPLAGLGPSCPLATPPSSPSVNSVSTTTAWGQRSLPPVWSNTTGGRVSPTPLPPRPKRCGAAAGWRCQSSPPSGRVPGLPSPTPSFSAIPSPVGVPLVGTLPGMRPLTHLYPPFLPVLSSFLRRQEPRHAHTPLPPSPPRRTRNAPLPPWEGHIKKCGAFFDMPLLFLGGGVASLARSPCAEKKVKFFP